jgi:isopentenyl-diphosphate delta-isomerase
VDIAKCLALGASLGGMASLFLKAACDSLETTISTMAMIVDQIRIAMFTTGTHNLQELSLNKLTKVD